MAWNSPHVRTIPPPHAHTTRRHIPHRPAWPAAQCNVALLGRPQRNLLRRRGLAAEPQTAREGGAGCDAPTHWRRGERADERRPRSQRPVYCQKSRARLPARFSGTRTLVEQAGRGRAVPVWDICDCTRLLNSRCLCHQFTERRNAARHALCAIYVWQSRGNTGGSNGGTDARALSLVASRSLTYVCGTVCTPHIPDLRRAATPSLPPPRSCCPLPSAASQPLW